MFLACLIVAQAPAWQRVGPGTVTDAGGAPLAGPLWALAANQGVVYAGGAGGLWAYFSGTWQPVWSGGSVSAAAAVNGVLFAGTGDLSAGRAGIGLASNRTGAWQITGSFAGLIVTRIAADPANAQHLLASSAAAPDSPAGAAPGLYGSNDGGATWDAQPLISGNVWDFALDASEALLASTDSGLQLGRLGAGGFSLARNLGGGVAAVCAASSGGFLALQTAGPVTLAAISDAGASVSIPLDPRMTASASRALAAQSGHIWLGGDDLWRTDNAGQSWTNLTQGASTHLRQHAVLVDGSTGIVWLGNDGGLWNMPSGGALANANLGLSNAAITAVRFAPDGAIAAGLEGGGVVAAADASGAWTTRDPGDAWRAIALDPRSAASIFAVSAPAGVFFHSLDGGATWAPVADAPASVSALAEASAPASSPWIGTQQGTLVSPAGASVTPPAGINGAITALAALSSQLWLAAGGNLWSSGNAGSSWQSVPAPPGRAIYALALAPDGTGTLAAATSAGVFVSWNQGANWIPLSTALPAAPVSDLRFDAGDTLWAATLGQGLWNLSLAHAARSLRFTPPPAVAAVGSALTLQATVTQLGQPVSGVPVSFGASQGGVSLWSATALSDSEGVASVAYTLPQRAGEVDLNAATADGLSADAAVTAAPAPAAVIVVVSGAGQSQVNGTTLAQPVILQVSDPYGNGVAGVTLTLQGAGAFGSVSPTNAQGQASVAYTLPTTVGPVTLSAAANGLPTVTWTETALVTPGYSLQLGTPAGPVQPNSIVQLPLQVTAIGGYSAAVVLHCVAPIPGCSIAPASVVPGQTATVSVDIGAFVPNSTSVGVTVASDAAHVQSLTLSVAGFTLASAVPSLSLQAGAAGSPVGMTVTAINGYAGAITFTAAQSDGSALPAALAAVFTPASLTLPASTTASLTLTASQSSGSPLVVFVLWWWGLACATALAFATLATRRRLFGVLGLAAALAGCGGSAPAAVPPAVSAPTATTYSITVTASGSGLQATAPLSVTVTSQ